MCFINPFHANRVFHTDTYNNVRMAHCVYIYCREAYKVQVEKKHSRKNVMTSRNNKITSLIYMMASRIFNITSELT